MKMKSLNMYFIYAFFGYCAVLVSSMVLSVNIRLMSLSVPLVFFATLFYAISTVWSCMIIMYIPCTVVHNWCTFTLSCIIMFTHLNAIFLLYCIPGCFLNILLIDLLLVVERPLKNIVHVLDKNKITINSTVGFRDEGIAYLNLRLQRPTNGPFKDLLQGFQTCRSI